METYYSRKELEDALRQLNILSDTIGSNYNKSLSIATYLIERALNDA